MRGAEPEVDLDLLARGHAGGRQELVDPGLVATPAVQIGPERLVGREGGRDHRVQGLSGPLQHLVDDRFTVERGGETLAHVDVVPGSGVDVDDDVPNTGAKSLRDLEPRGAAEGGQLIGLE